MIRVTRLNGGPFYVNPFEVEFMEETPDTVITLKTGKKLLVEEDAETVIDRMVAFYRRAIVVARPFETRRESGGRPGGEEDPYV